MLKALLHRFHQDEGLLRFLPPNLAESISQKPTPASIDFPSVLSLKKWFLHIHYSWFQEPLEKLPAESLPLFLSLFAEGQAKGLATLFNVTPTPLRTSDFTQLYLSTYLEKVMKPKSILPLELVPTSNLNILLKIHQKKLFFIIDFLGLHDLAADLKQIVDKHLIKQIHEMLTDEERRFLQDCSKRPSKWISPKLGLTGWKGERKALNNLLHGRGLIRLAKAIADEEQSYQWHLVHRFDTSRGKVMMRELEKKGDPNLIPFFKHQVLDIYNRIK